MAEIDVRLDRVTKRFADVTAVDDLSLEIDRGEFFSLLGPSGCGKTTTLRMIGGFEDPSAGAVYLAGRDVTELPPYRRDVNTVFQSYALFPHLTVADNVAFGLRRKKIPKADTEIRVREALRLVDLHGLGDRKPRQLSGGQQQRVALARALIVDPETLLLDEPLSNLDANLREEMRFEIRRLHDEYRYTTVYVTHDQSEAMTTADLIAVMNGGKIEQAGSPEEIYDRPRSEFVARFIGSSNVVKGKVLGEDRIEFAGTALRCTGAKFIAGRESAVSIRQHDIRLLPVTTQGAENLVPATVRRHVFLGNSRDYMVQVADGTQLRVVTSPEHNVAQGSSVLLHLPPERCRALAG